MRRREKGPAAFEVSSERRRKTCRRTSAQVESGSGDPNAGEHRARNTEFHPQGLETAIERYADHAESQVVSNSFQRNLDIKNSTFLKSIFFKVSGGPDEKEILSRECSRD